MTKILELGNKVSLDISYHKSQVQNAKYLCLCIYPSVLIILINCWKSHVGFLRVLWRLKNQNCLNETLTDTQSKNSGGNLWKKRPTSSRVPGCSATSCLWAPPNKSPAPSSPPTYRQPRRRPTQPSDTQPRALGSRNFVRILLASWLRWQLWSNCVWLKVFKVAKRQCGDHVTNPFRVDSTQ